MPSLKLADAWKDFTPPSPPEVSGKKEEKKEGGNTVHTDSEMFSVPDTGSKTVFEAAPSPADGSSLSAKGRSSFFLSPDTEGGLEPGNIDLRRRPVVRNRDGSVSMARSFSIAKDGREYLIPTVSDEGRLLSNQEAITQFEKTGRHLGAFRTAQDAAEYADRMDRRQELLYAANPKEFQGVEIQQGSLVAGFPGQSPGEAATPLSPVRPRSLFDRPLTSSPLISSPARTAPAYRPDPQRMEELHALVLHDKNDPELDALLERNPAYRAQAALDDGSMPARALLGQQILREVAGERYAKEPGFYFLALKEKLPETATRQEAYAAVYDHYAKAVEKQYEENKARKAAYQKNRAQVDEAMAHVVGGLWSPAELGVRLTPEQTDVYLKEFDTGAVEKAHAAFSLLKDVFSGTPEDGLRRMVSERAAMKITSALSDDDGTGKLTINETAFNLFEGSLRKLMGAVKEQSGDEWKFLHNVKLALFNPAVKRDATLGTLLQINSHQNSLVPFAREHNDRVLEKLDETVREYQAYIKNDWENARVLGLLSTGQDLGNQSNERASFAAKTVNCLGSVCGQTAPFFLPYAGWGIALAGAYDDKRNRAYYEGLEPGTAEWSAFVDAAASVAVEKISYGALGRLSGAGWVMGKLSFMNKARKALTDSLWKHVLFEAGAGMVEETFVEPTAEAIIQWAVRSNIAPLAGVDVGGSYDWSNYWNELKGMMEPDQLLATALFVGGLAGGTTGANSLIMQRSLVVNSRSPEMLMTQGIPEDEAKRISGITDNGERVAAVREAVSKLKTLPPEVVRKNAKEGVKAFRSLAEVRATVESEAYKFFQQEMRLPLVEERADKPGMYDVTVFDVASGQKKFTQEMAEEQLVSLFGNYFNEDKRAHIAEAQSAFAANAFLRTAEKKKVVQSQDMLQLGKTTGVGQGTGVEKTPEEGTEGNGKVEESAAGKVESGLSPEPDSPGSPVSATPARETREDVDSSGPLEDGSPALKGDSVIAENLSVLGKFIRTVGGLSQTGFSYLTRIALDEWDRRLSSGMSGEQAAAAPFAPLSPYAPLSSFLGLEKAFKERLKIAARTTGEEGAKQTGLFQMRTAPGTSPADILFLVSKGLVGTREMLEDLFEVGIRNLVKGDRVRLEAMGGLLRETQAGLQKLGFQGQFISPSGPLDEMKVVEGMSKLALSDTLINAESLPLPQWQKDLLQYHVNYLNDASYLLNLGRAWNLGREKGTITKSMEDILRDLGHRVHTIYDQARIEQQDIQAVMEARAIVFGNKGGPGGSAGGPTASQIRERQQRDEEEEKAHVTTGDRGKERTVPKEALQHPETVALPEAPESMQGVFANGASWNPDAGTWLGMVPVDKLHLSPEVPQVKVNSGKKGVVNPLVGDYRADAPPVYVWKRKNGKLEVVSGRHRLDLAQRTGIKAIPAYVYEEDSIHNARWARLLDYEQNMQDDQADELTAAIYVRETSLTDDELTRRGLTRSGTKSQRGLLIGREAREDLWTRFRSGAITAQNAEAICLLTQHIRDKARIDAMQTAAANDLARGKSLEFAAAKIQLMAHASADEGMVQGLISFGESFEQDMERAAEYVARSIGTINEHINAIKGVRNISKKGNVLATEGITAGLSEDPAERLKELELLKTMYEKIGLYENLRVRALTWDGKTPPDPIGDHRLDMLAERARAEADAAALEDEGNRKAAEKLTPEFGFSLMLSRNLETVFPDLWNEAAKELNDGGYVSFALNGSRVSIHTLAGKNFREALERGGLFPPVNRVADFSSGLVSAGEIACVLHPESGAADSRSVPLPEGAAGSGRRVPLSDFSGFVIPSSQEESLLPALLELGVPVRVYHVTGEEAAFLGDPRSMERDDLRKKKELNQRRNNVIRSFLEETDVSFSLSAAERRIATKAKREDTWMKAPDGTPTALTERQWLQVHSEAFREWFGESKIVNEHGEPVVVYHGTARADRVGTVFRGERATSGPMAFFTDNEGIAANYAKDKRDTSIGYEEEDYHDYHQQFRVVLPSGQDIPLERYWNYLSPADQRRVTTLAGQIREDWDGDNSIIVDPSINDANGGFPYHLQEARGNAFRALVIHWLESAILFDEEHRFLDVLEKLDLPLSPYYRDPNYQEPKVYACYMRMENPFRTPRITKKIIASLKAASRKAMIDRESWRTDLWDKNSVSPEDWIERLENDYENKTTHAWASIPDWVTAWLRKKGYDGIIDQGGKFHAEEHTVCIPFDSGQIKSATDNRGTFDPGNADITFSVSNLAAVHSLGTEKLAVADKLGGLPLPSLAVTRLDRPYTWGDDDNVYLVGSPDLADPARGVEIYDRDMWSGHFPELRWNRREEKEREEFYRKAEQAALRYYGGADISTLRFLKDALDGDHRGALESKLRTNDLSLAVFAGERGYAPRPLMTKIPGRLNTGDRIFYSEIRKMRSDKHANVLAVERQEEFCAAMERAIERYRTQFAQDSQENKLTISQTLVGKINLSEMEKELKEAREDNFDVISHLALIDASQFGKTAPDWSGNFRRFEKYAATHKKAFDAWVQDKMDRWLNPVPRIKENGFPATLENVTRYMLGSKGNGAEYKDSFFPTGLLRAKKSRRFHSLDQIKESRDILVTSDEYDASQEEAQGLIQKFQEALFGIVNDFSAYNKAVEALSLIEGEPTPSKVLSALSRLYRGASYRDRMARNSGNLLGLGAAALHAMKSELRDYYEAVPQRAVQLQEFSHAVMPASLRKNRQIRDILKRHGIRPLYHDGTLEGRTRAMASLMGSAASFSLHSGGTSEGASEAASSDSSRFRFPRSDFMGSLSEEERGLSEKALASGTWLKAPNGEVSHLTPRQWVQVRTAAFRDWFGDWLDDPGHASQVVDENGEPRVVYHGTPVPYDPRYGWVDAVTYRHMPAPFSVFGEGNWHGAKFFFDDYERAASFASSKGLDMDIGEDAYTFECFLNARKLFYIKDKEAVSLVIDSFPDSVPVIHPQFGSVEHVSREAASGLVKTFQSWILTEAKEFQQKLQELGYDGFVAADHDYYTAVFKSSQIKSATENVGTFDSSSPDITFSVIGLRAETWKQYKEKAFTGRDDGMLRAEIDASQAVLKDRSAPYLEPLRRELADLRESFSDKTKKRIGRFLALHWKFYRNKKGIEAEDHPDLWREYLSLDREREEWSQLLTEALLRTGLYHSRPAGAAVQAQLTSSLEFLLREDEDEIRALAHRAADNTVMTLDEWLDYPELFAAYPKLRSMPVISRYLEKGILGLFSPAEWTIYIDRNTSDPQKIRSILLHEIQHSIQQIEGFAKGGMPETARQFYEFMRREAQEAYDQSSRFMSWLNARDGMISTLEYMLSLARNPSRVLRTSYLYSYDNVLRRLEGEERILDMTRHALEDMSGILEQFYQEDWNHDAKFDLPWPGDYALNTPAGIKECLKAAKATPSRRLAYRRIPKPDLGALYRNLLKYEKLSGLSSYELYRHLAGEIESRHVEHRKDWSAERRAAEPFNDTLEYPGEALVSFSLGDGHSPAPESHSLPGSSPLQDVSQNASQDSQNSQDSLQNEYETEQSIHASSGPASFTERSLLPRSGEGDPGRGHSDEPAAGESHGADEGLQAGDNQAGSNLSGGGPRRETDAAHSGQFDPAVGVLGVKAYSLSPHLAELASRHDFYTGDIVEIENSAEGAAHFRRCLEEAKSSQVPYGECVYTYDAEEYEHMRLFLLPSGKAGFALKDGDMVSVFSHKQHGCEGRPSHTVIVLAVQMGASKCDCYGTILPNLYAKFGFRAVARDRFNAEFSPESMQEPGHMERWYGKQDGKPDVVYMVYEGNRGRVIEEFDPEAKSSFKSLPYSDFDACLEIQSRAVEARRNREAQDSMPLSDGDDFFPLPDSAFYSDFTFSLTSIQKVVSSLTAPSMQATRAAELVKDCDKAAENWRRIMSGKAERPSARVGAELFGMVGAFLSAARYVLPEGYRSNVDMQMQWASVYAAMAESGEIPPKGTLRSGEAIYKKFEESMINNTTTAANAEQVRDILAAIGSQRLDRVMGKILDRVRGQLIRYAKDELYLKTMKRVEVIYPKKEIGKKSPRGRLEAQAYRAVARCREMLGATAEAKAEAMETLEARFNTEEDEEKRQELEMDILAWKTYGDYAGMSLPQAQAAMEKLLEFIMAGRNSWADKLRKEAGRSKYAARQIQKNLPASNSATSRAGAKITHRTKLRKLLASLPYSFMSYAQLMLALEPVLGQRFSRARIKEISDANAALLNASNDRSAWLSDTIRRIAGLKSESAAEQWLVKFNTPEKTDIPIAPVMVLKVVLSLEEAQEWLSLSREERDARRKEIREEDRRTETVTENVPEEEDIPLLRQALDEYEKKSPEQQQYQKNVTSLRELPNEEASGILTCSRDCALYAILLHEQPDYADMYDEEGKLIRKGFLRREGLDDAGIGALYDFVGSDGLEYGYALRKRLQETGKTLAQVYEERMGVPFTFKENYFRATFDRNSTKEKDALTEPKTGSIGGGKYGLLIDRIIHSENLDFSKAGTLVFLAAAAEQDNYIYTSHITTAWRALLKTRTLEQKLKQNLGEDMMGKLSSWMDLIDGASLENNRAFLNLSRMQGMLQRAFAFSVLAGNGYVLLKQSTAILHGFFSGWVPNAVLERADGTRELAHRHISFADYLFHLAASKMGLGDVSLKEVMETPYFQARVRGKGAMLAQIGNQTPGQRYSRMEKLPEKAMDLIETVDVKANLHAMHALANAYYAKAKALNEENGSPFTDEQLRKAALEQIGMSLELGAQPLTKTQKSMNQAAGGILSKLAFVMKSEQLNKLGMMAAEWKTGSARNRVCAVQSWLALGVTSSLLAWLIAWIKGMDDDDDKEKKWKKYAATALLGNLTTIPLAGEGVNYLASLITGERVFADSYARTLVDVQGISRTVKKEYEHVADKKEMDWDTHFNNLTALIRAAGVGGAFSRSSSAVVSGYGALSLAAATGANISRTSKDLLSALFRDEDEEKRKKKKKRKPGKKKSYS